MDDRILESALDYFLKRYLRTRLVNRLLAYGLVNLATYMLLLVVMMLTDSSLFVFHLLFFCSLSLLPFFLFVGMERATLRRVLRSIDEHCLVESYLQTSSAEHHAFLRRRVESFLERQKKGRAFPFRLFRGNLYLVGLCLFALVLLQATSFITLRDFTAVFSARGIKTRLLERSTLEEAVAELPLDDTKGRGSAAEQQSATPGGETGEQRAGGDAEQEMLEELLRDQSLAAKDRIDRLGPDDGANTGDQDSEPNAPGLTYRIPGAETAAEKTSGVTGEEGQDTTREGSGAEAGSSDVGRTFKESPLREYTTLPEEIEAQGSEQLSASNTVVEGRKQAYLKALFSDFQSFNNLRITFNPLLDTIRERYLELLDERF